MSARRPDLLMLPDRRFRLPTPPAPPIPAERAAWPLLPGVDATKDLRDLALRYGHAGLRSAIADALAAPDDRARAVAHREVAVEVASMLRAMTTEAASSTLWVDVARLSKALAAIGTRLAVREDDGG